MKFKSSSTSGLRRLLSTLLAPSLLSLTPLQADESTNWLEDAQYGVMFHLRGQHDRPDAEWQETVNSFDVSALAKQLEEIEADYFLITFGQNSGHFCAPNETYNRITGYQPGTKTSKRDLVADLSEVLAPKGIKLMVYLPASPPLMDDQAERAFGFDPDVWDGPISMEGARNWAKVIEEWSMRYQDKVSGWWIDGAYSGRFKSKDEMRQILKIYKEAMTAGNPDAKVSFNYAFSHSQVMAYLDLDDYTAGELHRIGDLPPAHWENPPLWHGLTYLGKTWENPEPRLDTNLLCAWTHDVIKRDGLLTFDVGRNVDPEAGPIGTISKGHMEQFRRIRDVVRHGAKLDLPESVKAELKWRTGSSPKDDETSGVSPELTGDAQWKNVNDSSGRVLTLDGAGDSLQLGDPASLRLKGSMSLSIWIRPQSLSGHQNIVAKGHHEGPQNRGEIVLRIHDGDYQMAIWDGGDSVVSSTAPESDIGTWVHLAAAYDGMCWTLYRNGKEIAKSYSSKGAIPVGAGWALGSRGGNGNQRNFKGDLTNFRLFSGSLSEQEIKALASKP